jgi:hypothetical protein
MKRSSLNQIELLKQIDSSVNIDYHNGIFQSKTMEGNPTGFLKTNKKNIIIFSKSRRFHLQLSGHHTLSNILRYQTKS